jgi:hypothetical protein
MQVAVDKMNSVAVGRFGRAGRIALKPCRAAAQAFRQLVDTRRDKAHLRVPGTGTEGAPFSGLYVPISRGHSGQYTIGPLRPVVFLPLSCPLHHPLGDKNTLDHRIRRWRGTPANPLCAR